jgi:two-component system, NtrC family, response regulator GlrR
VPHQSQTLTVTRQGGVEQLEVPQLTIRVRGPSGEEVQTLLGLAPVSIGSSAEADVVVADPGVSRVHCELAQSPSGVRIKDLGSKNGVFVRDVRVTEAFLPPGVPVSFGSSTLVISEQATPLTVPLSAEGRFGEVLGASPLMRALFATLQRASASPEPILLLGESGTGKDALAKAIHDASPRREEPFIVCDCSSVPPELVESELFGHVAGAFTGATQARRGLFEQADGGTIFLDELGDLPLAVQPKLLRVLQERKVRPVGSSELRPANARVLAATHKNLRELMKAQSFREDLYFRLAVFEVAIPPLRERRDDIPMLVESFLAGMSPPKTLMDLPSTALKLLMNHSWPGNVRELRNTLSRLVVLPDLMSQSLEDAGLAVPQRSVTTLREGRDAALEGFERRFILEKLKTHQGNVSAAAREAGVSRQFFHRLMARYDIKSRE